MNNQSSSLPVGLLPLGAATPKPPIATGEFTKEGAQCNSVRCADMNFFVAGTLNRLGQMPSPSNMDMGQEQQEHQLFLNWRPPGPALEGPPPQLVHPGVLSASYAS